MSVNLVNFEVGVLGAEAEVLLPKGRVAELCSYQPSELPEKGLRFVRNKRPNCSKRGAELSGKFPNSLNQVDALSGNHFKSVDSEFRSSCPKEVCHPFVQKNPTLVLQKRVPFIDSDHMINMYR